MFTLKDLAIAIVLNVIIGALAATASYASGKGGGSNSGHGRSKSESNSSSYSTSVSTSTSTATSTSGGGATSTSGSATGASSSTSGGATTSSTSSTSGGATGGSTFTAGCSTGHPLTWDKCGKPEPVAETKVVTIYSPPMVVTLPIEAPSAGPISAPVLVPFFGSSVLFDTSKSTLSPVMQSIVRVMAVKALGVPGSQIGLASGHADSTGNPELNAKLAAARAGSVVDALVGFGFPRDRISVTSHGDREPLFSGASALDLQGNRRVDITILTASSK